MMATKLTSKQREVLIFASRNDAFEAFDMYKIGMRRYMLSLRALISRGLVTNTRHIYQITPEGRAALGIDAAPEPDAARGETIAVQPLTRERLDEMSDDGALIDERIEFPPLETYTMLLLTKPTYEAIQAQIAALTAQVAALRSALEPFAGVWNSWNNQLELGNTIDIVDYVREQVDSEFIDWLISAAKALDGAE